MNTRPVRHPLLLAAALGFLPIAALAETRVWDGDVNALWTNGSNWAGNVAPANGDELLFGASATTAATDNFLTLSLGSVAFGSSAPAYQLSIPGGGAVAPLLTLTGSGIGNASGIQQNLRVGGGQASGDSGAVLEFRNSAAVAANVRITNGSVTFFNGSSGIDPGGRTKFLNTSSAGNGVFFNEGSVTSFAPGGRLQFLDGSTAGAAVITNDAGQFEAGSPVIGQGGTTEFSGTASAGTATITNIGIAQVGFPAGGSLSFDGSSTAAQAQIFNQNGGQVVFVGTSSMGGSTIRNFGGDANRPAGAATIFESLGGTASVTLDGAVASGAFGAQIYVSANANLENATVTADGSDVAGGGGGIIQLDGPARAGNATLIANSGTNGGAGGTIFFFNTTQGNTARAIVHAGAILDNSGYQSAAFSIGSIEGAGTFAIGAFFNGGGTFSTGANNLSTTVSGVIQNGGQYASNVGTLIKTGTGTLTLSGANTYTGTTSVNGGGLLVTGSLANGAVSVAAGAILGGTGTLGGAVSLAGGATLSPGTTGVGTLTLGTLSLSSSTNVNFDLGAPGVIGGAASDLLQISGALTLDGILNVTTAGGFTLGTYRLANYTGAFTNNGLSIGGVPAGFSVSDLVVQTSTAGQVNLVVGGGTDVLFWDGAQTVANNVIDGGVGNWNNATTNWTTAIGKFNAQWASKKAVFAGTAGTVTLTENIATDGLQFSTTGYTINANAGLALTLTGSAIFTADPGLSATINAPLAGTGALTKAGTGTLTLAGGNTYGGGTTVADGVLIVTDPGGAGLGTGPVTVRSTLTSGLYFTGTASGGALNITNNGGLNGDSRGIIEFRNDAAAGTAEITNQAATTAGNFGAFLAFRNDARATAARITNLGTTGGFVGNGSGFTSFADSSSAGSAIIDNFGSSHPSSSGGLTRFSGTATAGASTITNRRGAGSGGLFGLAGETLFIADSRGGTATILNVAGDATTTGGFLQFQDSSDAETAQVTNAGAATVANGLTIFSGNASAGRATLTQAGATAGVGDGGELQFEANAKAGSARIVNGGGAAGPGNQPGTAGGLTTFENTSSAEDATFLNEAGIGPVGGNARASGGTVEFYGTATAARATFNNRGGVPGVSGGRITFNGDSTAAAATITNAGGISSRFGDGEATLTFLGTTDAGTATIINLGGTLSTSEGGATVFAGTSTAQNASITNRGGNANTGANGTGGGRTVFDIGTRAGAATFTNEAGTVAGAQGGSVLFGPGSSAENATFFNLGATQAVAGGRIRFEGGSTAGAATFRNDGGISATENVGEALLEFAGNSSADSATILNAGGTLASSQGGGTQFFGTASASTSAIEAQGSSVLGGEGGYVIFADSSRAASARLTARSGSNGGGGGLIQFGQLGNGETARVTLEAPGGGGAGELDIGFVTTTGTTIGSLDGGGIVSLGSRNLRVGGNGLTTEFSGLLRDGGLAPATGGSLTHVGPGALTLSGANTYTGGTLIGNGITANSGKIIATNISGSATGTGPVTIRRGGTLSGSGFIAGPVLLQAGGAIVPGDPVTLTLQDSLTWDGGSVIRLALGPDQAGSDLIQLGGALIRGDDSVGAFTFELVDFGAVIGQTYDLLRFSSNQGFSASAFTFTGPVVGDIVLANGALALTVTAVPEPGAVWSLVIAGAFLLASQRPRRAANQSADFGGPAFAS